MAWTLWHTDAVGKVRRIGSYLTSDQAQRGYNKRGGAPGLTVGTHEQFVAAYRAGKVKAAPSKKED